MHPRKLRACAEPRRAAAHRGEAPLVLINIQTVLPFSTILIFLLEDSCIYAKQLLKGRIRIWNLGAARFRLHQGPITDSLPPLTGSCCDGSRSAPFALHSRVWRRLPYTTNTRIGVPRLFSLFPGYLFLLWMFFKLCFRNSGGNKSAKFDQQLLAGYLLDSSADCSAVSSKSQPRGWLAFFSYDSIEVLHTTFPYGGRVMQKAAGASAFCTPVRSPASLG